MSLVLAALLVWIGGGALALLGGRNSRWPGRVGPASAVAGSALALVQAARVLFIGPAASLRLPWQVPLGSFHLGMDSLSAFFTIPIALVCALAAIYGSEYLAHAGKATAEGDPHEAARRGRKVAASWFFFNVLAASMTLVVAARNGVLFLAAWEAMSLASFFLAMFDSEVESVRRAGWTYLVASHLGTAFLLAMFCLVGRQANTLDFDALAVNAAPAGVVFFLGLIGFGVKAGFVPLHVWLPEAHPAAPSHVSAVMSGVMIKMGLYGLLRMLTLLGPPPELWGWTLVSLGAVSGILGVVFALAQQDLKRLLAYSSVENVGIVALGLGTGLLGISYNNPAMAALGLAGGLLHLINHSLFKSLLFLGAGAVLHATGTRNIDQLGGLLKRMPITGASFLVGAAAICGLPPLNGFVGELLIYLGAFCNLTGRGAAVASPSIAAVLAIGSLALIGGLAAVCFSKAFGIAFLGEPRSPAAAEAHEAGRAMRLPMLLLAGSCAAISLFSWLMPRFLGPVISLFAPPGLREPMLGELAFGGKVLAVISMAALVLLSCVGLLVLLRTRVFQRRQIDGSPTWDCGYVAPTPRMQYSGSSFTQAITGFFHIVLRTREELQPPDELFPQRGELHTRTPDVFYENLYALPFRGLRWLALRLHWLQQGRIQLYVLYLALTLLALLVWKLG